MKFRKSKGKYWYRIGNDKQPYDRCICGKFKNAYAKKCFKCLNLKKDGTFKKKPDHLKRIKTNGYIMIYKPSHYRANSFGYVFEHIVILEKKIGRKLKDNECSHHINKKRDDNRPENLQVMTKEKHSKLHNPKTGRNPMYYGKHFGHKHDYCSCGNLKDVRAKKCKKCYYNRFKKIDKSQGVDEK